MPSILQFLEAAEHLIEGVVLQDQEDDMLDWVFGFLLGVHETIAGIPQNSWVEIGDEVAV